MVIIKGFHKKQFKKFSKGYFGIIAAVIGLICDFLAVLLFPNYDFTKQMVSELALGPGGIFFNLGLIIPGIIAIPFVIYLGKKLQDGSVNNNLKSITVIIAVISCISVSLTGVFPSTPGNTTMILLHGICTFISWIGGAIIFISFGFLMLKNPFFPRYLAYYGFMTAGVFILYFVTVAVSGTIIPIFEWMVHLSIKPWSIINGTYLINKKFKE